MYFVTYTSVQQQVRRGQTADEGVRSALSQQHCRGRECLLRAEKQDRQVLDLARAADAQATMLRRASNRRAMLQLLEADTRAEILPEEGQGRERIFWEAAWANRQREMDIWETRCRVALLGKGGRNGQVGSRSDAVEAR